MATKASYLERQIETDATAREIIVREAAYTAAKTQRLREARLKREADLPLPAKNRPKAGKSRSG